MRRALVLAAALLASPAAAATWQSPDVVVPAVGTNSVLGVAGRPAAFGPDGTLHLVYQNALTAETAGIVYVARSPDGIWNTPVELSLPDRSGVNPNLAVDREGRVHVFWTDNTSQDGDVAYCMRDTDGTWTGPALVDPAPGLSGFPAGAVDAFDRVHVVWEDARSGTPQILHASCKAGEPWSAAQVLSVGGNSPDQPEIAADGNGAVHVVWHDRVGTQHTGVSSDIFYLRLDPNQTDPQPVHLVSHIGNSLDPFIEATADGTLHLVWVDDRITALNNYYEIYYKRYLPGIGWGHDKRFTYDNRTHARPVIVAGAGNSLNVVWEDYRAGNPEIYYRQITPEIGWDQNATRITDDQFSSQHPTLVTAPDGNLVILWSNAGDTGTFQVIARDGSALGRP